MTTLKALQAACADTTMRCERLRQAARENGATEANHRRGLDVAQLELHTAMGVGDDAAVEKLQRLVKDHRRHIDDAKEHARDIEEALKIALQRSEEAHKALTEYRRTRVLPRYQTRLGALEAELAKAAARVAVARGALVGVSPFRITVEDSVKQSRYHKDTYTQYIALAEQELVAELER